MSDYPAIEPAPRKAPSHGISLQMLAIGGVVLLVFGVAMWAIAKRKTNTSSDNSSGGSGDASTSGWGADNSGSTFVSIYNAGGTSGTPTGGPQPPAPIQGGPMPPIRPGPPGPQPPVRPPGPSPIPPIMPPVRPPAPRPIPPIRPRPFPFR